ncbi:MAG: transglycosylase SLT domain-containing protein [Planctomycetes bacterium]|jgi:hypothetical protein|nr:transglycosylase SLT domain-containing protein [Planctomycetota bacterium]
MGFNFENIDPKEETGDLDKTEDNIVKSNSETVPEKTEDAVERPKDMSRRDFNKLFGLATAGLMLGLNPLEAEARNKARITGEKDTKEKISEIRRSLCEETKAAENKKTGNDRKKEKENKFDAEATVKSCLTAYDELARRKDIWPADLFTDDFVIALQAQESKGDPKAVSPAGALGIMQVMPGTISEVHRYLGKQKNAKGLKYDGPVELSDQEKAEIEKLILTKGDYGRAYGKIYLMRLFDNRHGFKIGNEDYRLGNIEEAQKNLLAAYNAGPGNVSKVDKKGQRQMKWQIFWPAETRKYWKRVFEYKQLIARSKNIFKTCGLRLSRAQENFAANILINKNKLDPGKVSDAYIRRKADALASKRRELAKNNSNLDLNQILNALS